MSDYDTILDTSSSDVAAAVTKIRKTPPTQRGRGYDEQRVLAFLDLIRRNPGHPCSWYAAQMGVDNHAGQRMLMAAERLGYRLAETPGGLLYVTERTHEDDDLAWLDVRRRPDVDGVRRLLFAVLAQAAVEAYDGLTDAIEWWHGPIARHYCHALDLDHDELIRRLRQGREQRIVRKPSNLGRTEHDRYKAMIFDRYNDWRQSGLPLDVYAERVGVKHNTLCAQFNKFGLSTSFARRPKI